MESARRTAHWENRRSRTPVSIPKNSLDACTFTKPFKQELIDREVVSIIKAMSHSRVFEERIREELNAAVDVDKLKEDVERMRKAVANNETARKMLARQMGRLDASDANYERKYKEMLARLDSLCTRNPTQSKRNSMRTS